VLARVGVQCDAHVSLRRFGVATPTEPARSEHVRVTTAFNKLLAVPGANVVSAESIRIHRESSAIIPA